MKREWNLVECFNHLTEEKRYAMIGDGVGIFYQEKLTPVVINGIVGLTEVVLKEVYTGYDIYDEPNSSDRLPNFLMIEEYMDSCNSILINEEGKLNYEYFEDLLEIDIHQIVLGEIIKLYIVDDTVTHYELLQGKLENEN